MTFFLLSECEPFGLRDVFYEGTFSDTEPKVACSADAIFQCPPLHRVSPENLPVASFPDPLHFGVDPSKSKRSHKTVGIKVYLTIFA